MNRHEYRVKVVVSVYQHLLLEKDLIECYDGNIDDDLSGFTRTIIDDLTVNTRTYINRIEPLLKRWTFDRLSFIDQAILIEACSEFYTKTNSKNIIIDEAIRIAKEYSDEESYKYINGVLDNL